MALEVRNINYKYQKNHPLAVRQVSFSLTKGERVVLAGINGSGKSTLLKIMAGLYKPLEGDVRVDGYQSKRAGQLLPGVGLVVAHPERYFFGATVEEELAYGLQNRGVKGDTQRKLVGEALQAVGLGDGYRSRNPFFLSLGEQRKVGIAAVLATQPDYLLMDEPFSNLDRRGIHSLLKFLENYAAAEHTVVVSSHRTVEIVDWGRRIMVMEAGSIIYDGEMEAWQSQPLRPLMLGDAAYMRYLLSRRDIDIKYTKDPVAMADMLMEFTGYEVV